VALNFDLPWLTDFIYIGSRWTTMKICSSEVTVWRLLFGHIQPTVCPTLLLKWCNCEVVEPFSHILANLQVLDFLKSREQFLDRVLYHLGTSAIMDLLLRLVTSMEPADTKNTCVQVCVVFLHCISVWITNSKKALRKWKPQPSAKGNIPLREVPLSCMQTSLTVLDVLQKK